MSATEERGDTSRLEAFSDGVFAIAITLLVLDLKSPTLDGTPPGGLAEALRRQGPVYLAYVTSFVFILIMWVNHHNLFRHIRRCDHWLLFLNGGLLMGVCLVPFPTGILAEYLRRGRPDANTAAAVYNALFVAIAILFNAVWLYAIHRDRLLGPDPNRKAIRSITVGYRFGPWLYLSALLLAVWNVAASVGLDLALALFFVFTAADTLAPPTQKATGP